MSDHRRKRSAFVTTKITLAVVPIMVITGCGSDATEPQDRVVVSVVVTPENATLESLGETVRLAASARDANGNVIAGKTFVWQSSDVLVVRVDSSGLATAVANGTTAVTATTEDISGSTTVAVRAPAVIVSPSGASISGIGATQPFTVQAWDADGNPIPSPVVSWRALNVTVADIDASGVATGVASGQVTIRAEVNGIVGHALLTVSVPGIAAPTAWNNMSSGTASNLRGVWGASSSDVFAVGSSAILHYDGSDWGTMTTGITERLAAIWGTSSTDVYAVGPDVGGIFHYDGSDWSQVASAGERLAGVWGSSPSDIYAVGRRTIIHYDGSSWRTVLSDPTDPAAGGTTLSGVWGTSSSDIFAVGDFGKILHYDGTEWSTMTSGTNWALYAVWGTSGSDVYAVGGQRTILHYDGSNWSTMSSDPSDFPITSLIGVWGTSPTDIYAADGEGSILRYDGAGWNQTDGRGSLQAVWTTSAGDVYAVGAFGAIVRGVR